ncbi:pseudouridine synthase [Porphyromonas loveana]|uniref:pseudouridine synthase n=1 Tax=Porphyromonas loveana TaxID=1884669 RepID=UPI00359F14E3
MQNKNTRPSRPRRAQDRIWTVDQADTLLPFLIRMLTDNSRTTVKQYLTSRRVSVNAVPSTRHDTELKPGDKVVLHRVQLPEELRHPLVRIIWQDDYFILVEKKAGIPTVGSGIQKDRTALRIVSNHLKQYDPEVKVFMLNRLDRDSAGIILFAKTKRVQEYVVGRWPEVVPEQRFVMAVEGDMPAEEGLLAPPRHEDQSRGRRTQVVAEAPSGDSAGAARYKVIRKGAVCTLVEVTLLNGRNNQLRRQMGQLGIPIAGDWRQGSSFRHLDCLAIQGTRFVMRHPETGEEREYKLPLPKLFRQLMHLEEGSIRTETISKEKKRSK